MISGTCRRRATLGQALFALVVLPLIAFGASPATAVDGAKIDAALKTGPEPDWIRASTWAIPAAPTAPAAAEVILNDAQDQLSTHTSHYYAHQVVRLLSAEGVRKFAQVTVDISPDFETVTWHILRIHRDGKVIDRLPDAHFSKLQRELALEAQMLTGEVTLACVLDDIRVGDVLETAFTRHYANPLFEGRLSARHYLGNTYPTLHERVIVHVPAGGPTVRPSFTLPEGTKGLPEIIYSLSRLQSALGQETQGDTRTYSWEGKSIPSIEFDGNIPARASPYWPRFRVSSFTTWSDVVEWAEPLFTIGGPLPDPLPGLLETWKKEPDPGVRLEKAVHWVQNELRYFALELGQRSFRPRPLSDVCSTRYGDCKDKALVLTTLLRALGFEAWPALVNTYWRDRLHTVRPDPYAFNHAVVAYRLGNELHWVDATLKGQQGPAGEWAFPPYRTALIIRPGENDLVDVAPPRMTEPDILTTDVIRVDAATGDATLTTEVAMQGLQADYFRQTLDSVSAAERAKGWFNFVARFYRRLEELEAPVIRDNTKANRIFMRATYRLPGFVQKQASGSSLVIHAYALRMLLNSPDSRRRLWPYALDGDRFVRHRIQVELPFEMPAEQHPELIRTDGIEYRVDRAIAGRRFNAQHDLRITQDYVAADRITAFSDVVEEILDGLATSVRRPPENVTAPEKSRPASSSSTPDQRETPRA